MLHKDTMVYSAILYTIGRWYPFLEHNRGSLKCTVRGGPLWTVTRHGGT